MAEKTGFIIYYEMLENLKTLGNDITVEVLTAISKHDQGLEIGNLSPQAQFAFNSYIPAINRAKKRWETSVYNGKQHKPKSNLQEPNNNLIESSNNLQEPNQDLHTSDNVNDNVTVNVNGNGNGNGEKQPPPFLFVKNKIKEQGFFLDDDRAIERLIAETGPPWFEGRHTFIDFVSETVRDGYGDKPEREQHRIFRKLLFDAPNLRDEYPQWRQRQEKNDALRANEEALEAAWENHPVECDNCGAKLCLYNESWFCYSCNVKYEFSQETRQWDYHGPPEGSISEMLKDIAKTGER